MRQRTWNYSFYLHFVFLLGGWSILLTGCSDNPEAEAAKNVRNETSAALDNLRRDGEYKTAQDKVMATVQRNRASGLTRDGAVLASGVLALNRGIQEQSELGLLATPVRSGIGSLEKLLRRSEELMVEKSRIEVLLTSGEQEKADLQKMVETGTDANPALNAVLADAQKEMDTLAAEKSGLQEELKQVQGTLDDYQQKADDLLRQAESARAEQRLTLQQQGYDMLKQRKQYGIQAQELENKIAVLDSRMALVQGQLDNLNQSVQQIKTRIDDIDQSEVRQSLNVQAQEIGTALGANQLQMTEVAQKISSDLKAYKDNVDRILAIYEEATGELQKVQSQDAKFAATIRLAEAAHQSALALAGQIRLQTELNERLVDLLQTTEPTLATGVQERLPIGPLDAALKQKTMDLFATAFENYQQAYDMAGRLGQEAQCSLLKSHLLAMSQKMQLADRIGDFDLANQTETALNELIRKGTELGTCFTQSETMRVIQNEGLNYLPELPLNIEVLAEGLRTNFSAWKRLPINEQEQAVQANLQQIDALIAKYGQELGTHLEPLRQEMIQAKERGFKEAAAPAPASPGAPAEPNSVF